MVIVSVVTRSEQW